MKSTIWLKQHLNQCCFSCYKEPKKDGYINITGVDGKKKIEYITSEKHVENYEDPEEKVRAEFFLLS